MNGPPAESSPVQDVQVLVVDDEESMRHFVSRALSKRGYKVLVAAHGDQALEIMAREPVDVLVTDVRMPGLSGHDLFARVREMSPGTRTVIMTAYGTIKDAVMALRDGADMYLTKPFETDELLAVVGRASEHARMGAENRVLHEILADGDQVHGLVGKSRALRKLLKTIDLLARTEGTILIVGESGTGKELVARAIHKKSPRSSGPFVGLHCGSLPPGLVEAEIFGVEPGAYTGAERARLGYIERAEKGTLFLDEVSEIPLEAQPSLLRFLECFECARVGGTDARRIDVRVLAASNVDLKSRVEAGRFRADLYYRLNVLPIEVPSLRDRRDDIPLLVAHFLRSARRQDLLVTAEVQAYLHGRDYPGNVRELQNLVERVAATVEGSVLTLPDVTPTESDGGRKDFEFRPYRLAMERFERDYLEALLVRAEGNISEAARLGGIARPSLHARISALGIDMSRFR